ncbi:PAS domain-containing protein [Kordiimonas sp. SCSIO 12610]|uniref:PAS domain-containing protein n=1 Tax=Kordiimonas sp. SCSIO 12610 TaxID=2829597 RepID=UPI00210A8E95|nr:PAS domain-containing protein [Kordiimonas sp. SCSIO 12610]UTW56145.1 PAS domain-containing protein [Kordiimonas sp. SCSIO 12610]
MSEHLKILTFEQISSGHPVKHFGEFWQANKNEDGLFPRAAFNPARCLNILPWVVILKYEQTEHGPEFFFRLCGTGFTELVGRELTGDNVRTSIRPDLADSMVDDLAGCLESGKPRFYDMLVPVQGREFIRVQRGVFPVSSDGRQNDQLFIIVAETGFTLKGL